MFLAIRMVLYFVFAFLAGQGVGVWDETAGTFTLQVDSVATIIAGSLGFVATFAASRFAKVR